MLLKIKLDNKTYTATSIVSAVSREAMKINRDALELAKVEDSITQSAAEQDYDKIAEILDNLLELKDRKAALIVKAYGNKFDLDTLLDNVTDAEIDQQINLLTASISSMVAKK